jgi:hypothetical protein
MSNVAAYAEKVMLDYILLGTTTRVGNALFAGLSLGVPSSVSGSEMTTGVGYGRQTCTMVAAVSPAGSATNANAMTFGPFSSAYSITGIQLWDSNLTLNSGNMLWYGTLTTARTLGANDSLVIAAGSLTITLA